MNNKTTTTEIYTSARKHQSKIVVICVFILVLLYPLFFSIETFRTYRNVQNRVTNNL